MISGAAGPVTKAIGIRKRRNEKILISFDIEVFFNRRIYGSMKVE